jgi:hypothetical protein
MIEVKFCGGAMQVREEMHAFLGIGVMTQPSPVANFTRPLGTEKSVDVVTEQPDAPKRTRRTKEQIAADAAKDAQPEVHSPVPQAAVGDNTAGEPAVPLSAAEDVGKAAAQAAPSLTLDAVRQKLKAVNEKLGMDAVKRILGEFGLEKVSGIKPEQLAVVAAAADKAVGA